MEEVLREKALRKALAFAAEAEKTGARYLIVWTPQECQSLKELLVRIEGKKSGKFSDEETVPEGACGITYGNVVRYP